MIRYNLVILLATAALIYQGVSVKSQVFDAIFQQGSASPGSGRAMSVNLPMIYDMAKNGSSMGINVLSGMVKVERGHEAERNGLVGRRPLSIRIFGIPVFERGVRVHPPNPDHTPSDGPQDESTEPLANK